MSRFPSLPAWVAYLTQAPLPVLPASIQVLQQARDQAESLDVNSLARDILRDPLLTLKVIHYIQDAGSGQRVTEITTIGRALMMLGMSRFSRRFSDAQALTDMVTSPLALEGVLAVIRRAHAAAVFAREWSNQRHDIDTDEVVIAALLHDMAEILLWLHGPDDAAAIQALLLSSPGMRSVAAQREVLGFSLLELQLGLASAWHLPSLITQLMDDQHAEHPRVKTVHLAVSLARHTAYGANDPAIPDDLRGIEALLHLPEGAAEPWVERIAAQIERDRNWYHWTPPAPESA